MTATGSWTIYQSTWQFSGSQALDEAYVPFFGAFGAAREDATVPLERQSGWNALA